MKICTKCNSIKALTEFSKQKRGKFGVRSTCKECIRGISNADLLNKICLSCNKKLNSLTPYKKYCNNTCKQRAYRISNPEQNYLTNKLWKTKNKNHINELQRRAYKNNPSKYIAKTTKRIAIKLNASLPGYDDEIQRIYDSCPSGSEVHHIIPLRQFSDIVCGLHVPWNLQILTKEEHIMAHRLLRKKFVK